MKFTDPKRKKAVTMSLVVFVLSTSISAALILTEENILTTPVDKILVFGTPIILTLLAYFVVGSRQSKSDSIDV